MSPKICLAVGAIWVALGIGLGAFGAHLLEPKLVLWYPELATQERMRQIWETAVRYQLLQGIGMVAYGLWLERHSPSALGSITPWLLLGGSLLFSGLLYALVLTGYRKFGAIVPVGGLLMSAGWLAWATEVLSQHPEHEMAQEKTRPR
jgi:uncharacterized membrane protein YgdD (TMEM256/DUF423 family)